MGRERAKTMWVDLFTKTLKWSVSAFFLILALLFLDMVRTSGNIEPIILAIFSFGIVYWLYRSANEIPWQIGAASLVILTLTAGVALYVPFDHFPFNVNFYLAWASWTVALGAPVIAILYRKYGN